MNGEPAWTYDDTRKEFYYHTYSSHMPDLNLTNADVVARLDVRWFQDNFIVIYSRDLNVLNINTFQ